MGGHDSTLGGKSYILKYVPIFLAVRNCINYDVVSTNSAMAMPHARFILERLALSLVMARKRILPKVSPDSLI
jgi:hypothetical protein